MRLTKPKSNEKNNYISKPHQKPHKHTKNISMDQISSKIDNNQSVYLHKILLKNLGNQSPEKNFPNYKENIENFQSSIQNIFSNEEIKQIYDSPTCIAIKMTYNIALTKRVTKQYMVESMGINPQYWGFFQLTDEQFDAILKKGEIDESIIIN